MPLQDVFVGLGGNIGDSLSILKSAVQEIRMLPHVHNLQVSQFYKTSPVSSIAQNNFINAVCRFTTSLNMHDLFAQLQLIETKLGKIPKDKQAPRVIDLDLLLFGKMSCQDNDLTVPHPEWKNRLFVLIPMLDLTKEVNAPEATIDLQNFVKNFLNHHNETIIPIEG